MTSGREFTPIVSIWATVRRALFPISGIAPMRLSRRRPSSPRDSRAESAPRPRAASASSMNAVGPGRPAATSRLGLDTALDRLPGGARLEHRARGPVLEAREVAEERELHRARRAVALLPDDDLGERVVDLLRRVV